MKGQDQERVELEKQTPEEVLISFQLLFLMKVSYSNFRFLLDVLGLHYSLRWNMNYRGNPLGKLKGKASLKVRVKHRDFAFRLGS